MKTRLIARLGTATALAGALTAGLIASAPPAGATACFALPGGSTLCVEQTPKPDSLVGVSLRRGQSGNVLTAEVVQSSSGSDATNRLLIEGSNSVVLTVEQAQDPTGTGTNVLLVSPAGVLQVIQVAGGGACTVVLTGVPFPTLVEPCPAGLGIPILPHILL